MAAGDTFRAAASEQLEVWAERTGSEIVTAQDDKVKASSGLCNCIMWLWQFVFVNSFVLGRFLFEWVEPLTYWVYECVIPVWSCERSSFSNFLLVPQYLLHGKMIICHLKLIFYIVLSQAVKKGKEQGYDVVLCDTSGRGYQI